MAHPSAEFIVTGANGKLGSYLLDESRRADLSFEGWSRTQVTESFFAIDLSDIESIQRRIAEVRPKLVFHLAAAGGDATPQARKTVNELATQAIAEQCASLNIRLIFCSTDMVFAGNAPPYSDSSEPDPISEYGKSKLAAERIIRSLAPNAVIARLPLLFGPTRAADCFFAKQLHALRTGQELRLFTDEWRTPLSYLHAARYLVAIGTSPFQGVIHLGGPEKMSRYEMGERLARHLGIREPKLVPVLQEQLFANQDRPKDLALDSALLVREFPGVRRANFEDALAEMGVG